MLLNKLNHNVKENLSAVDFDKVIEENLNVIFDNTEKLIRAKRLLVCAYLKLVDKKPETSRKLCTIYKDSENFNYLLTLILKRSIYE